MDEDKVSYFYRRTLSHIALVYRNATSLVAQCPALLAKYGVDPTQLLRNIVDHDKTKFREPQLSKYIEITWYYYKLSRDERYPLNKLFSTSATILHIITEPHHPEYWDDSFLLEPEKFDAADRDGLPAKPTDATSMPLVYVAEMVCDWCAVSQERGTNLKDWADYTVNRRWTFTELQEELIYDLVGYFMAGGGYE